MFLNLQNSVTSTSHVFRTTSAVFLNNVGDAVLQKGIKLKIIQKLLKAHRTKNEAVLERLSSVRGHIFY